ncbi:hypothetical protein EON81_02125 [bacterium]|nr:MAG: hypothetical protein EON81_02125 [bacterium]
MKLEIVLENLRPAKIQLVTDPSLGKVFTGKMTLLEKNGKIPVPKGFLNNLDAFYEILEVRDKSGRKLPETETASSGELSFGGGFLYEPKTAFLIIKKK